MRERRALEARTGAAKARVPNEKKKEIYKERRIAVYLSGVGMMRVGAGKPGLYTRKRCLTCFISSYTFLATFHFIPGSLNWCFPMSSSCDSESLGRIDTVQFITDKTSIQSDRPGGTQDQWSKFSTNWRQYVKILVLHCMNIGPMLELNLRPCHIKLPIFCG